MEVNEEILATVSKTTQAPPEPTINLPPLTVDVSPYEGLNDNLWCLRKSSPFFFVDHCSAYDFSAVVVSPRFRRHGYRR